MQEEKKYEGVIFPEALTNKDKELIIKQCENQNATSKEQVERFILAYQKAKNLAFNENWIKNLNENLVFELILELGALIEKRNVKGARSVEVTFGIGRKKLCSIFLPLIIQNMNLKNRKTSQRI